MRRERDSIGEMDVQADVYYGIQTVRSLENFPVSGRRERPELVQAYAMVKKAAAMANKELGVLDSEKADAIIQAAGEVIAGGMADQFPVDIFQAGAGTSFHMNVNEVLANRALEICGRARGEYGYISPNDHVNRSQSTNDTFPTASHIAIMNRADHLLTILSVFISALEEKGQEFLDMPKSGRTHLMDAVPVTLGDEFLAYAAAVARSARRIRERRDDLLEVALGGTATGTGANTPPGFRANVIEHLSTISSLPLMPARDSLEALQSRSQMAAFSGSLRELSNELGRIANDLRLLGSGPVTGLGELVLPAVQPGSSIMPAKVNPVMAECLNMVSFQVIGNDCVVSLAAQAGQVDLNVMTPVMTCNILDSLAMLNSYLPVFVERCVVGIEANEGRLSQYIDKNPILATLLSPRIGYLGAAEIARESARTGRPVRDIAIERGILTTREADDLFDMAQAARNRYGGEE